MADRSGRSRQRLRVLLGQLSSGRDARPVPTHARAVHSGPGVRDVVPEAAGFSSERLKRIDAFVQAIVGRGEAPMAAVGILRHGRLVHFSAAGHRDEARQQPIEPDTIYRMFSMTKPVVSVALLMLYEEGRFLSFDEPVSKYIPCFRDISVYISGDSPDTLMTRPAKSQITIKQLLTHTSGLGYGFVQDVPAVSKMYNKSVDFGPAFGEGQFQPYGLQEAVERLAKLPLLCDPGTEWHYSHSTDVVGYLVEVLAGRPLADFLHERIFAPLGMVDTGFFVPQEKVSRFAALYAVSQAAQSGSRYLLADDPTRSMYLRPLSKGLASGGGGLVSTMPDWFRWTAFLLRKGATEDGACLLSPKTFDYAALNHLPGGADLEVVGAKATNPPNVVYKKGQGWSLLGFAVLQEPAKYDAVSSAGELAWGSLASGYLWLDHVEDLAVVFKTQLMPSAAYPWRRQLHGLVYGALLAPAGYGQGKAG